MTRSEAERAIAVSGAQPDDRFSLFEAALQCALHEGPERDDLPARALVDEAAERLADRLKSERPEDAICEALGGDLRLGGDRLNSSNPADVDLISVCERRRGLPAALGILYMEVARRCGLHVCGVDFPNHFLLRIETEDGPIALDPLAGGRVVMPSELTRRAFSAGLTPDVADRIDRLMAPVRDRQVALRLQNHIFAQATRSGDHPRAERSALRRALLDPLDHRSWLDVAAAREGQGALNGALEALAQARRLDGGVEIAARAQRERVRLRLN
jgi:regulator of sirC expression with transglutaminase-like and TPR domain